MYACIPEMWRRFFEGVCAPCNASPYFGDPPPPRYTKTGAPALGLRPAFARLPR
jgi:hypothetical protein